MTQAAGTLLVVTGIFIVFRLQIQKERLSETYSDLHTFYVSCNNCSKRDLRESVKEFLEQHKNDSEKSKEYYTLSRTYKNLLTHENNFRYAADKGIIAIIIAGTLFIYYISVLHHNDLILGKCCELLFFILGFLLSIVAVIYAVNYIIRCVLMDKREYLF